MRKIASIVVKDGLVVQSFNYSNYLPLGTLNATMLNLERWGVEEILIKNITKSDSSLDDICGLIMSTPISIPITYGGFIRSRADISMLLNAGVDRFCFDKSVCKYQQHAALHKSISEFVGRQAMVANLNIVVSTTDDILVCDYSNKKIITHFSNKLVSELSKNFSELILNDISADGEREPFDMKIIELLAKIETNREICIVLSGGIGKTDRPSFYQKHEFIDGIIFGNSLYRSENAYQNWAQENV